MASEEPERLPPARELSPRREPALTFNDVLRRAAIDPGEVRLLRHQDASADPGRSPFALWRNDPAAFIEYQARQALRAERLLMARFWAAFVVTPGGETLFADLYAASFVGIGTVDCMMVHRAGEVDRAGTHILFDLQRVEAFAALSGRLVIEWGRGYLAWIQRADQQEKSILELRREYQEERFPGFADLILSLSAIPTLPPSWVAVLRASRGIYLLTCPWSRHRVVSQFECGGVQRAGIGAELSALPDTLSAWDERGTNAGTLWRESWLSGRPTRPSKSFSIASTKLTLATLSGSP